MSWSDLSRNNQLSIEIRRLYKAIAINRAFLTCHIDGLLNRSSSPQTHLGISSRAIHNHISSESVRHLQNSFYGVLLGRIYDIVGSEFRRQCKSIRIHIYGYDTSCT